MPEPPPRIRVRFSPARPDRLRWWKYDGWSWHCPCCDTGGRASSRRWPSHQPPRIEAFARTIGAVDKHLRDRHTVDHFAYVLGKAAK